MEGLTVGVEEEYQLVDAETYALRPGIREVLPTAAAAVGDQVEPELHQSQIEVGTAVCRTLDEVRAELTRLRVRVAGAAEAEGFRLVAAGTHPFARRMRISPPGTGTWPTSRSCSAATCTSPSRIRSSPSRSPTGPGRGSPRCSP